MQFHAAPEPCSVTRFVPSDMLMHMCYMSNNSFSSITPESPKRYTAVCGLLSENKPKIIDHLIRLGKLTRQNWQNQHEQTWWHLYLGCVIICVDKTAKVILFCDILTHLSYCLLQGPCTRSTVISPPHCLSDIDNQQRSPKKPCWISETSDLLPITVLLPFLLMPFFMLIKGEVSNGKNTSKFLTQLPLCAISNGPAIGFIIWLMAH